MASQITANLPALDFPKEVDYPTQEDWAAFSAAAELNFGILGGDWSTQMQLWKTQANVMSTELNTNANIAQSTVNYKGDWISQGYALNESVSLGGIYYICKLTHSTGQNPTDVGSIYWNLAIGNWNLKVDTNMSGYASKTTPIDTDLLPLSDSTSSFGLKKLSWANIKATLKTYFDTLYLTLTGDQTVEGIKTFSSSPIVPTPTTDTQVANKSYVDGKMVLSTAVTVGGTAIDFTNIPSWVKKITVMFDGVSVNGTSSIQVQLGSTTIQTTGYSMLCQLTAVSGTVTGFYFSTGFGASTVAAPGDLVYGNITLTNLSSNIWTESGLVFRGAGTRVMNSSAGAVNLSGTLNRIRITTANGTDIFDAGSINIMYEG